MKYQIPQQNISQSETGIDGPELLMELYDMVSLSES